MLYNWENQRVCVAKVDFRASLLFGHLFCTFDVILDADLSAIEIGSDNNKGKHKCCSHLWRIQVNWLFSAEFYFVTFYFIIRTFVDSGDFSPARRKNRLNARDVQFTYLAGVLFTFLTSALLNKLCSSSSSFASEQLRWTFHWAERNSMTSPRNARLRISH